MNTSDAKLEKNASAAAAASVLFPVIAIFLNLIDAAVPIMFAGGRSIGKLLIFFLIGLLDVLNARKLLKIPGIDARKQTEGGLRCLVRDRIVHVVRPLAHRAGSGVWDPVMRAANRGVQAPSSGATSLEGGVAEGDHRALPLRKRRNSAKKDAARETERAFPTRTESPSLNRITSLGKTGAVNSTSANSTLALGTLDAARLRWSGCLPGHPPNLAAWARPDHGANLLTLTV